MSSTSALQQLAERVSTICSEYRRLKKTCSQLERKVKDLSEKADSAKAKPAARGKKGKRQQVEPMLDRQALKTKVEEMLSELADIG